jgi:hypothetical protein
VSQDAVRGILAAFRRVKKHLSPASVSNPQADLERRSMDKSARHLEERFFHDYITLIP